MTDKAKDDAKNLNSCEHSDKDDNELDELLDSALEDFSKPTPVAGKPLNSDDSDRTEDSGGNVPFNDGTNWCEEFLKPNSAALEEAIQSILNDDPELAEGVKKIAELTSKAANGEVTDSDINSLTQEFLTNLTQGDDEAAAGDLSSVPEELTKMFENLKTSVTPNDNNSFPEVTSAMQTIMQMLLSKELLYPALQDIAEKYPDWLAENRPSLEAEKFEAFNRQYHIIKQICNEFEAEAAENDEGAKRYEKILDLMQKMQECGQPPAELIGDMGNCTKFDGSKLPNLSGFSPDSTNQCSLM